MPPIAARQGGELWLKRTARSLPAIGHGTFRTLINRAEEGNILHYTTDGRKTHRTCGALRAVLGPLERRASIWGELDPSL